MTSGIAGPRCIRSRAGAASRRRRRRGDRIGRQRKGNTARFAKGETQEEARRRKQRAQKRNRHELVCYVRERDQDHCRLCGRHVQYTYDTAENFGEVHEYVFRSLGGSDTEPTNCVLICKGCHTMTEPCVHPSVGHTSKRLIVPIDDDAKMEGPIVYRDEPFDGVAA